MAVSPDKCDICRDQKIVRLQVFPELQVTNSADDLSPPCYLAPPWREFSCPQCVPMVPYRRVRATKVTTAYDAVEYGKFQMPIERSLAARFGEFLLREGLIKFTTKGSADFGAMDKKIVVTAHLGVVALDDVKRSGAVPEIAMTKPPNLPRALSERAKAKLRISVEREALEWNPPGESEPITDEFDEPKNALGARFAGLEID
jgi:hypothetical protein